MSTDTAIMVIAAPACVVYLVLARRSIRAMRGGDEDWRRRWRQLDPDRRQSIRKRMKSGEAVADREEAELALRAVAQVNHVRIVTAPMTFASTLLVLAWLVVGAVSGSTILIVVGVFGVLSSGLFDLLSRRQRNQYKRSTAATQRLHQGERPPPE